MLIFVSFFESNFDNELIRLICCVFPKFLAVRVLNNNDWVFGVMLAFSSKPIRLVCVCELNWDTARRETSCACDIRGKLGWTRIFINELLDTLSSDCDDNTFNKLLKLDVNKRDVEHKVTKLALDSIVRDDEDETKREIRFEAAFEFSDWDANRVRSVCCVDGLMRVMFVSVMISDVSEENEADER